jgi:hypothetical protein
MAEPMQYDPQESSELAAPETNKKKTAATSGDQVLRKVYLSAKDIDRMNRLTSLYRDELGDNPKEIDIISYFITHSFALFLASGEIDQKVAHLKQTL